MGCVTFASVYKKRAQRFCASVELRIIAGIMKRRLTRRNLMSQEVVVLNAIGTNHSQMREQCQKICCKVAVIFLAPYALKCVMFCSNDCFSVEKADFYFGRLCMQRQIQDSQPQREISIAAFYV